MTDKPWKLVLLLTGIFAAGLVAGSFGSMRFARYFDPKRPAPEEWGTNRLKSLKEQLDLTAAQVEQLRPIMKRDTDELRRVRESSMKDTQRIFQRMEQDIAAILTPEQKTKFDDMNREARERMQKFLKDRRPGWSSHPPGGEPPLPPPPTDKPSGN
ncbi:MAG TPA: hypothetical protein VFJ90_07025 [Candidatus Didemnitutus sp.]|nr:hypothetical protein [Candidatus Didemnitutus sp.]